MSTTFDISVQCNCTQYGPLIETLYPRSVYRCSECGEHHGTNTFRGAVNWQCPREWIAQPHHAPADQAYVGCLCGRCNGFVPVTLEREIRERNRREQAARWNASRTTTTTKEA